MKKIIATILAIAMTVSMFTMVFSGEELITSAKTNYSAKVEQIEELLDEVLYNSPFLPENCGFVNAANPFTQRDAYRFYVECSNAHFKRSGKVWAALEDNAGVSYETYAKKHTGAGVEYFISNEAAFMTAIAPVLKSIAFAFDGCIKEDGTFSTNLLNITNAMNVRNLNTTWGMSITQEEAEALGWDWDEDNNRVNNFGAKGDYMEVVDYLFANGGYRYGTDAEQAIGYVLMFSAFAVRFGQGADSELFSADFNANRTKVYDIAIKALSTVLAALKAQVTSASIPSGYAAELPYYVNFAGTHEDCYNSSYGINPYIYLNVTNDLASVLGINLGFRWYTFDEIQANAEWAALLADFQLKLRAAQSFKVDGVLYPQFAAAQKALEKSFADLCWAIVGKQAEAPAKDWTYLQETVIAATKLWAVVDFINAYIAPNYDLYAKTAEVSAAIWTLQGQLQFAETVIDYLELNDYSRNFQGYVGFGIGGASEERVNVIDLSKMRYVDANALNTLIANIEASIAKLVPSYGQELTPADVEKGIDLYKKAQAIYNYMTDIPGKDDLWSEQVALIEAINTFDKLLPYAAGEKVVAKIDFEYVIGDSDWVRKIFGEDAVAERYVSQLNKSKKFNAVLYSADINFEYAPVAFAYLSALAELEEIYEAYLEAIQNETFDDPSYSVAAIDEIYDALKPYEFLFWTKMKHDGDRIDSDPETVNYFYALTGYKASDDFVGADVFATEDFVLGGFLGLVLSDTTSASSEQNVYDYATRNYVNFYTELYNAFEIANDWDEMDWSYIYGENGKIDFSEGFDILDVIISDGASILADAIEKVQAAAKLLCVNYTKVIVKYDWVLEQIEETMNITLADEAAVQYTYNKDAAPNAADWSIAQNYTEGNFKALVAAMTVLNQQIARYHDETKNGKTTNVKEMVTLADLETSYANVIDALYALLTAKGAAAMDTFFEAVEDAFTVNYSGVNYNNPADVKTVLDNYVDEIVDYFPAVVLARPYDYFAYTLNTIAHYDNAGNIYYADPDVADSPFELNFYNAFAKAVDKVKSVVNGQYAYAAREQAAKLHFFASDILAGMGSDSKYIFNEENWNAMNMPLWYAQELTAYLNTFVSVDAAAQSAAALAVKKAADLDPIIAEANAVQTGVLSAAVANQFVKAYETAKKVSVNGDGKFVYIYSAEEIDAAALALRNALLAVYAEIGETVYTLEDVLAKVDAIVATATARAEGSGIDVSELVLFATNVKQQISTNYGSVSQRTQINTVTSKANALFTDALKAAGVSDQYKAVKADKALYTAGSYDAYMAAYDALNAMTDVSAEAEGTYATAKAAYDAAYNALLKIEDAETAAYKAAVEALAYAQTLVANKDQYTAESFAALEATIAALQAAVDSYASDADLQAAIVNFKVAEAMLVEADVNEVGTLDD